MTPARLPRLREEIALLPGPALPDGQPSWTLHDPVRNLYFQLDWPGLEILARWHLDDAQAIVEAIRRETTLLVEAEDLQAILKFLADNQLLQTPPGQAAEQAAQLQRRRGGLGRWLLHNYLFFRIPLVRPDAWLARLAPHTEFFFSRSFFRLTLAALLFGALSIYREWEQFSGTLVDMLTWHGLVAYGLTIIGVKTLHELGHAIAAKRLGCRVPTMGLAFLVLWPVAYTDTNDVWRLRKRRERLQVAAAGIVTELSIAAWAGLAWAWLPEGGPRTAAFLLATTTWISTLAINASPFMRFDGYFLLADFLRIPNLHSRAFALARWDLRERLFALGEPCPEHFPSHRHTGLILFAWTTWIYRLVVFLGIAALVYSFFIKAVGVLLFLVEIVWFVLWPAWTEIRAWQQRWPAIRASRRARRSALLASIFLLFFVLPWPTRVSGSGLLRPLEQFAVYAPEHARLRELPVRNGDTIAADAPLLGMDSPALAARARQNQARIEGLSWQSAAAGFDPATRRDWQILDQQLATSQAEARSIDADAARYAPRAPYSGRFVDIDPDLRPGDWLANRELLGRVVRDGGQQVVTYVDDEDIQHLHLGDRALFVGEGSDAPIVRLHIISLDRDASRVLNEPELASLFGGHVQVREKNGGLHPERAAYRVLLAVDAEQVSAQHTWRGNVTIAATWEAPGMRYLRSALRVIWREFGF